MEQEQEQALPSKLGAPFLLGQDVDVSEMTLLN
jgi:hypothetical protein